MEFPLVLQNWPPLKDWFVQEAVEYPWGENPDSYSVWISEIMLQQTQVRAVIPYFLHWKERYPNLKFLAAASEEEVMRSWEGLGYYSRARNILKTARILNERGVSQLPADTEALLDLPGIGGYTAAAIASIAYGRPVPVMDANVKRICQRLSAQPVWNGSFESSWKEQLTSVIEECGEPGMFNCALMQLGQLVCRKSSPDCEGCPFRSRCRAYLDDKTETIPASKKKNIRKWNSQALIYLREGAVFLEFRDSGVGKGLWSMPRISENQSLPEGWKEKARLKPRPHNFTTNRELLHPVVLLPKPDAVEPVSAFAQSRWVLLEELSKPAMPSVYRRIVQDLILIS